MLDELVEYAAQLQRIVDDSGGARQMQARSLATLHEAIAPLVAAQQSRSRVLANLMQRSGVKEAVKRKFEALSAYAGWQETPATLHLLSQLLRTLVFTGLLAPDDVLAIGGWHDLCARTRADDWLSADAMHALAAGGEHPSAYLPVTDPTSGGTDLIPVADAWYSPRLGACFRASTLRTWVETWREESLTKRRSWPETPFRQKLSLVELFSLGADPFNLVVWTPPLVERTARLAPDEIAALVDVDRLIRASESEETRPDEGVAWYRTLGTFPNQPQEQQQQQPPPPQQQQQQQPAAYHPSVNAVEFSPDGRFIASGGDDGYVRIWYSHTGHLSNALGRHIAGHPGSEIQSLAYSPDGLRIVSGHLDHNGIVWNELPREERRYLEGHTGPVTSVAFSPDGSLIASGSRDFTVCIWNSSNRQLMQRLEGFRTWVSSVAFSPNGSYLVAGSNDRTMSFWKMPSGQLHKRFVLNQIDALFSIAYSPNGLDVAVGSTGHLVMVSREGIVLQTYLGRNRNTAFLSMAFSPDGRSLALGTGDGNVEVWEVESGRAVFRTEPFAGIVNSVAFSPDGLRVASGSSDGTVRIWDAATGQQVRLLV